MSEATQKLCIICGSDCSSKPRIKDGAGRYACRACYDERREAAEAAEAAEALDETRVDLDAMDDEPISSSAMRPSESLLGETGYDENYDDDANHDANSSYDTNLGGTASFSTDAPASMTQSASFHDLTALEKLPELEPCPRCGRPLREDQTECPCGATIAGVGDIVAVDRLTGMGFLFTEQGAWKFGAKGVLLILGGLSLASPFIAGCIFAEVTIVIIMAAAAWGWAVWNAIADKRFGWAVGLFFAYPFPGLGTIVAAYHAYFVNKRKTFKQFHTLIFFGALFGLAAWGVQRGIETGWFESVIAAFRE